ncbi:MAG: hypothetical protein ACRDS0_08825 [Pseudonocardiaceae bacterium]
MPISPPVAEFDTTVAQRDFGSPGVELGDETASKTRCNDPLDAGENSKIKFAVPYA